MKDKEKKMRKLFQAIHAPKSDPSTPAPTTSSMAYRREGAMGVRPLPPLDLSNIIEKRLAICTHCAHVMYLHLSIYWPSIH